MDRPFSGTLGLGSFLVGLLTAFVLLISMLIRWFPRVQKGTIAFFHPFADGGGGGERVLWVAVQAAHAAAPNVQIVIYIREGVQLDSLVEDVSRRFNIDLGTAAQKLQLVHLKLTHLLLPENYRRFTLIRQAIGSVRVGHEALTHLVPQVFIDTTGWAFTFPLARLVGCKVAAYVHYPTISSDMISRVAAREATYNNNMAVAGSAVLSTIKLVYYKLFALVYGGCGGCAHVVMANGSWTRRHVQSLFWPRVSCDLVYPPCDTEHLQKLPLDRRLKELFLLSVAQFRPEKNHRLQLAAFAQAKAAASVTNSDLLKVARLKMVGSCRNDDDKDRLHQLQAYAQELDIADSVDWRVNVPFSELQELLGEAVGGLHTMKDEHFGISVVEYMAAGAIPIAHNSAGPREDIVVEVTGDDGQPLATGYLATTTQEYADAITKVLLMDQRQRLKIASAAQKHASSFSGQRFQQSFTSSMQGLLDQLAAGAAAGAGTAASQQ